MSAKIRSTADAHTVLADAQARRMRLRDRLARGGDAGATAVEESLINASERAAATYLSLASPPQPGTGGELAPVRDDADELPGIRDTVQNPDYVTVHASNDRLKLADEARAYDLSADMAETIGARNSMEKALAHQMAAAHALAMRLVGRANAQLEMVGLHPRQESPAYLAAAAQLAAASSRLMDVYQRGMLAVAKVRRGNKQTVNVVHQHVHVAGGQVAVAGAVTPQGSRRRTGGNG